MLKTTDDKALLENIFSLSGKIENKFVKWNDFKYIYNSSNKINISLPKSISYWLPIDDV